MGSKIDTLIEQLGNVSQPQSAADAAVDTITELKELKRIRRLSRERDAALRAYHTANAAWEQAVRTFLIGGAL